MGYAELQRARCKKSSRQIQTRFPNIPVTPIEKIEFRFNLSKNVLSANDFMTATQFPLKLAFACTAHEVQGSEPDKAVVDLRKVREAAQSYVMCSRVQCIDQIFFYEEFLPEKIFPSESAIDELRRLKELALNTQEKSCLAITVVVTLNIRTLRPR